MLRRNSGSRSPRKPGHKGGRTGGALCRRLLTDADPLSRHPEEGRGLWGQRQGGKKNVAHWGRASSRKTVATLFKVRMFGLGTRPAPNFESHE
jgi:hypothetical protein